MNGGNAGHSAPARAGILRRKAFIALVLAGLPSLAPAWIPFVEMKFESGTATSPANTGSAGGSATLSGTTPAYSANLPINGGAYALDFGSAEGNYYADLTAANVLTAAKSLKSFTITGWVNCRSSQTNTGGGRIISWNKQAGNGGVDLAFRGDGSLGLGVNTWNDQGGVASNPTKITVDPNVNYNNWRFFAVTYDGTKTSNNVQFYFGTNNLPAALDLTITHNKGTTSATIAPSVTIGNVPSDMRSAPFTSVFRGLIDQIRVYGSTSNNTGVLTLDQIQSLQQAVPMTNVAGVVYDQWNNISGTAVSNLTSDARFPSTPSVTKLQANFEGFEGSGDSYGSRVSGWVKAPATGSYIFWIVADDAGELRVSTDANPANKRLIASVATYNSTNTSWTQYPSQQSEPVELQANQYYYVEALMKENNGGDFVRVGWQLPSGTQERPIPQSRVVTTPPDAVPFYTSEYPLYESGTYLKKASMSWQKASNNDHFSIKTDQTEALTAKNGTAIVPTRLFFGGLFPDDPNQNDLGFRWDRADVGTIGHLYLQTQQDEHWAMSVEARSESEPHVTFNQLLEVSGPDDPNINPGFTVSSHGSMDYFNGTIFDRVSQLNTNPNQYYVETSAQNGSGMLVTSFNKMNSLESKDSNSVTSAGIFLKGVANYYPEVSTVNITSGNLTYARTGGTQNSQTIVDPDGITTPRVTTSMWKVAAPDYVFDKGYKLRSLEETERFVKSKKHLPEIPSAKELSAKGLDLTEMNMRLLQKVEELTLHMIAMDKELKALKAERQGNDHAEHQMQASNAGKEK